MPNFSPYGNSGQAHCACRRRQTKEHNTTEQNNPPPQPPPKKVTPKDPVIRQQRAASRQTPQGAAGRSREQRPKTDRPSHASRPAASLTRLVGVKSTYHQTAPRENSRNFRSVARGEVCPPCRGGLFVRDLPRKSRVFRGQMGFRHRCRAVFPGGGKQTGCDTCCPERGETAVLRRSRAGVWEKTGGFLV